VEVSENPNRKNITYVVQKMENQENMAEHFRCLFDEIVEKGKNTRRTIIYCQTIKQSSILFSTFQCELGDDLYYASKVPQSRMVEMLYSSSPESVKSHVLEQFAKSDSYLRVLIATIAYGMGVNCKNVTRVINLGPSKSLEALYAREWTLWER